MCSKRSQFETSIHNLYVVVLLDRDTQSVVDNGDLASSYYSYKSDVFPMYQCESVDETRCRVIYVI